MEDLKQFNSIASFEPVFAQKLDKDTDKKDLFKFKPNDHQEDNEPVSTSVLSSTNTTPSPPPQPQSLIPSSTVSAINKNKFSNITVDDLVKMGNDFLAGVNKKRSNDEKINDEFEKTLSDWANNLASKIKEISNLQASKYSQIITEKFNLITEDLEQVEKLEQELVKISKEVEELYKAIKLNE